MVVARYGRPEAGARGGGGHNRLGRPVTHVPMVVVGRWSILARSSEVFLQRSKTKSDHFGFGCGQSIDQHFLRF
ncbi:hypothetical protein VTP01DRAFT_10566 [Rhizomucor pusillus]|uniref:uncharacterized protein n=1 Tax=Rhizomucor pusillus TaxID=4840 RepID=UPI0037438224